MTDERFKAILEFGGKFILPAAVLVAVVMFRPVIDNLPNTAESAEFMGLSINFRATPGFRGDLTPRALYYLIGSVDGGGVRYESKAEIEPINELQEKGLVSITIEQSTDGSPEMQGTWAELEPTESGLEFLNAMQVVPTSEGS